MRRAELYDTLPVPRFRIGEGPTCQLAMNEIILTEKSVSNNQRKCQGRGCFCYARVCYKVPPKSVEDNDVASVPRQSIKQWRLISLRYTEGIDRIPQPLEKHDGEVKWNPYNRLPKFCEVFHLDALQIRSFDHRPEGGG